MFTSKICVLTAGLCALPYLSGAQRKNFTMAEATNGLATTLSLQSVKQPSWQPGSHSFFQVVKAGGSEHWVRTVFPQGTTDTIETLKKLNKSVYGKDSLKGLPVLGWIDHDYAYYNNGHSLYKGVFTGKGFTWDHWHTLPDDAANVTVDKSQQIAYTVDNHLWLITKDKKVIPVALNSSNILSGQAVHRNEFGIEKGIFFSPRGNHLAYYHMNQQMVKDYLITKWGEVPATIDSIKYPMAGGTSHQVEVRVYDIATGKTTALKTGKPWDQYLTSVTWGPDEKHIYVALLNRNQNHLKLNQYNAATGEFVKTLFEERNNKYVEPEHELSFLPGSNDRFIWWSERDGYDHLYLYSTSGKLIKQLTSGKYVVNELIGFNEAGNEVIITAAKESPLEKHVYAVNMGTGRMRRLNDEPGVHTVTASEDGAYIFDTYTSANVPKVSVVRGVGRDYKKTLLEAKNTLTDYDLPVVNDVTLAADDGTPLYGKIILPTGFDAKKKYPVVVYLYNGPHVQLVRNTFPASGNLWYEYMAQRGYIVFTMDGRGSSNRGRAFEQAVFRTLGTTEMNDQLKGVAYLKSLPYVDQNRMGVHGWSFGGFMTTSLMLRHPDVFKVGVAGGPVIDWSMYEVMYTERYMDTPQENPEGYAGNNLLTKVKNLKGKLLMIHGTDDDVVVWQHSIKFIKQSVSDNVQVDYFVYPGHPHNVRGKDRVHLMQKITDYFDTYLK